jgi:hypothetical protein
MPRMGLKLMTEGGEVWVEESIEIGIASEFWAFLLWDLELLDIRSGVGTIERTVSSFLCIRIQAKHV